MDNTAELEAEANALLFEQHTRRDYLSERTLRRRRQREVGMGHLAGFRCRTSSDLMVGDVFDEAVSGPEVGVLHLRAMGWPFRRIADEFGCSHECARQAVADARPVARDRIAAVNAFVDEALRR